jgi:hypothetical protein
MGTLQRSPQNLLEYVCDPVFFVVVKIEIAARA